MSLPSAEIDLDVFSASNPVPSPATAKPGFARGVDDTATTPGLKGVETVSATSGKVNTQIYCNSPLSGSAIEQDARSDPKALFGRKLPNLAVIQEKAEHRIIILLKAQGFSNREIAKKTGIYTECHISQVLRQPWAQKRLMAEIYEAGGDAIQELLRGNVADSILTLVEIRDNGEKDSDRVAAAKDILDRFLGKPTQRIETKNENHTFDHGDVAELDRQLAEAQREEKRLIGDFGTTTSTVNDDRAA